MALGDAAHFANNVNYEVQRTNHFEVEVTGLVGKSAETVRLSVQSVKIPSLSIEVIELKHGNSTVKAVGANTTEGGDLTVLDAIGADTEKVMYDWYKLGYNPESSSIGRVVDYKKVARLIQYSPDGATKRTWRLEGVFLTSFDPGELSYDGSDKKIITCSMSVDKCIPER